jgi:hypothetical protein
MQAVAAVNAGALTPSLRDHQDELAERHRQVFA